MNNRKMKKRPIGKYSSRERFIKQWLFNNYRTIPGEVLGEFLVDLARVHHYERTSKDDPRRYARLTFKSTGSISFDKLGELQSAMMAAGAEIRSATVDPNGRVAITFYDDDILYCYFDYLVPEPEYECEFCGKVAKHEVGLDDDKGNDLGEVLVCAPCGQAYVQGNEAARNSGIIAIVTEIPEV